MKLAIIGLPKSGKTAVFDAIVGPHKERHAPSHAAVQNVAMVKVADERLNLLKSIFPEKKATPAFIELLELGGIFSTPWEPHPDAAAVALLREMDGAIQVVRTFKKEEVPHPKGPIDPARDIKDMDQELLLNDLIAADKRIEKLQKAVAKPTPTLQRDREELDALLHCKWALEKNQEVSEAGLTPAQKRLIKGFCFLTEKPRIVVLNIGEDQIGQEFKGLPTRAREVLTCCGGLESELWSLEEAERKEFQREWGITELAGPRLLKTCYDAFHIASFYTTEGEEIKVWSIPRGETALTAAGKIHTDIARGFIKAEVVSFNDLKTLGSIKEVKNRGKLHLVGKEYIVQDGDIITFRFHV